ncbi:MAG TPA: DUF6288 domain-containing protein [Luteolibacter sp.]|nr:DUF6288 domain-containing protein [Luteolibacter sp.]
MKSRILPAALALLVTALPATAQNERPPDFTKGDPIPANAKHDWNLGATGMRGWIYSNTLVTYDARQIYVTQVDTGSPADGTMAVGDVILGVGGGKFSYDPRTEFGKALTHAESEAGAGNLTLTRWRAGKTEDVTLKLPVLGSYSATAPYDCEKSRKILELGCKTLAARIAANAERENPIPRSLNALGLLASGDPDYLPLLKKEAEWAANFKTDGFQTWYYGYVMLFLGEYVLATGDQSAVPGLRRMVLEAAKGQSAVGSWGHGYALPDGRLGGYGMMNSPGIPLTISLVMARAVGIDDPAISRAIERSQFLLRFYVNKGSIPYGDHDPWIQNHDDNGKNGMAATLFNLTNEKDNAEFFSRMSLASHGPERDTGHTGNFFNILWATPGVALSGPQATGIWMKNFGSWYFDLARRPDGSFVHLGPPEPTPDSYHNWDATGLYLLAYAMPLRKIYLTGKRDGIVPQLNAEAAQAVFNDGIGWDNKDRHSFYDKLDDDELFKRLSSWSPVVRDRAAIALSRRPSPPIDRLIAMLESTNLDERYGACDVFALLRGRAEPAVDPLIACLSHSDMWLRVKAAEALTGIGKPAAKAVPKLLELMTLEDKAKDPRNMHQRYITIALFNRGRDLLAESLATADRDLLHKAVSAALQNQDGRARSAIESLYDKLSYEELKPLLPVIMNSVAVAAPSGEMFADGIRVAGCKLLAKHHVREGMALIVKYTREQNSWASEHRTPELMKLLLAYGTHARKFIPELEKIAHYFEHDEPDFPRHLGIQKVNNVRETIAAIRASTETPELKSSR